MRCGMRDFACGSGSSTELTAPVSVSSGVTQELLQQNQVGCLFRNTDSSQMFTAALFINAKKGETTQTSTLE